MQSARRLSLLSGVAVVILVVLLSRTNRPPSAVPSDTPLLFYCAAGLKPAVAAAVGAYEQQHGRRVEVQYGGSGTLLSNLRVAARGDLYLAADAGYIELARSNGLVAEVIPIATMTPVIGVARGNPKGVESLDDLLRAEVALALANPDAAAIGKVAREMLAPLGKWEPIAGHAKVFKPTVNDLANDLKIGAVDAAILWDATASQYPEIEAVAVPELSQGAKTVEIGVLRSSRTPTAALHFARYLTATDRGLPEFERAGYRVLPGDAWAEHPEVVLYSGGVNRVAVEETIRQFEEREGAQVTRVYNGCGILVSQIKSGQRPDAYFACDVSFMDPVGELFGPSVEISETDIVLLVPKGNPKGLKTLRDLTGEGLRLGLANPQQSTLGALTERLLRDEGILDAVMANVRSQTPTADLLVNQLRTGSLDAVVVYEANTSQVRDTLDVLHLDLPGARAIQPYAVGKNSAHPRLMERLLAAIRTPESRERYARAGFRWKANP
ncbi:MAG: extracellular solute-binding protein [Verrucomicrobiales bacterium]|nr:extracellular solute-binding protein [Verrucomicrobiales bacterium]